MIDSNTLLQTDATVIAGVLILLTIYSLEPPRIIPRQFFGRIILAIVIVASIFPFSSSAFYILSDEKDLLFATHLAKIGFIYIMVAVSAIVIIPFISQLTTFIKRYE